VRRTKEILATAAAIACVGVGVGALPAAASAEVCPNAASRSGPSASLPDCRAYEIVSPARNEEGNVYTPRGAAASLGDARVGFPPFEAAPNGSAVTYGADPLSAGSGGDGNSYLATRNPSGGWTALDLEPPGYKEGRYQGFSEDLSTGILNSCEGPEEPLLAPEAPSGGYNILYAHSNGDGGSSGYRALITAKPPKQLPCKNLAASFGSSAEGGGQERAVLYAGATSDLSHILFEANDALTANATPTNAEENNLYDQVGGELRLVNVLPGESHGEPDATFGSPWQEFLDPPDFSHVISNDGSHIFWTDLKTGDLYVRENGTKTTQLDASQGGSGSGGGGWFWTASSDGEKAFFTDCSRLTPNSTAVSSGGCGAPNISGGPRGNDLYEWDEGRLTDLTVDHNAGDILGADVGGVLGASENGEYVYFVASGALAPGALSGDCASNAPTGSLCNLYLSHNDITTFIAALSPNDDQNDVGTLGGSAGSFGDWQPNLGHRSAEVTSDGHALAFMSDQSLTGYDNVVNGEAMNEVYVYDAEAEPHLSCVSCDPSGAPPSVFFGSGGGGGHNTSFLPVSENNTNLPRWISDEGDRVFFDSVEPLVSQDTNRLRDVYEWERDGAGSCQTVEGCVYLLSGGTSTDSSSFVDASADGKDVFFVTRAQLVSQDRNEEYDLYDARIGGVQPLSPSACSGTGCQGVPSAQPLFATPPSVTFNGVGNFEPPPPTPAAKPKAKPLTRAQKLANALKACSKRPKNRRAGCKAQARKLYGAAGSKAAKGGKRHA
jgi:hypothetical protein